MKLNAVKVMSGIHRALEKRPAYAIKPRNRLVIGGERKCLILTHVSRTHDSLSKKLEMIFIHHLRTAGTSLTKITEAGEIINRPSRSRRELVPERGGGSSAAADS